MEQSKMESLIETLANTAIGYLVALGSQLLIFPMFDIHVSLSQNLLIGLWFTAISIARGYVLRRYFNAKLRKASKALAAELTPARTAEETR